LEPHGEVAAVDGAQPVEQLPEGDFTRALPARAATAARRVGQVDAAVTVAFSVAVHVGPLRATRRSAGPAAVSPLRAGRGVFVDVVWLFADAHGQLLEENVRGYSPGERSPDDLRALANGSHAARAAARLGTRFLG